MSPDDARAGPDACDHCGGEPTLVDDGVPAFECADCGNVLGLADPDALDSADADDTGDGSDISAETITATDGRLDQLVGLLRSEVGPDGTLRADRLHLDLGDATLEVTADGDRLELREREDD